MGKHHRDWGLAICISTPDGDDFTGALTLSDDYMDYSLMENGLLELASSVLHELRDKGYFNR